MDRLQLLKPKEACKLLNISVATLYRWEAEGTLPIKKIKLGPRAVFFRRSDIETWLSRYEETPA